MKRNMRGVWFIVSLITVFFIGACGKDSNMDIEPQPAPPPDSSARTASVQIQNLTFTPGAITITKGTTVTWTNNDAVVHTVTADDNSFSSPSINPGGTYSRTFNDVGTIKYHCIPHPHMMATITVQ